MNEVQRVDGKNTFKWKIGNLMRREWLKSPDFEMNGFRFSLFSTSFLPKTVTEGTCWGFWIIPVDGSIFLLRYTLIFVDDKGQDFVATNGTVKGNLRHQALLGFFKEDYLKKYNIIENGIITLRITIELDSNERKEQELLPTAGNSVEPPLPASALEQATQTEASCPWLMRNITTNTETEQTTLLESLSEDLGSFYDNKTNTDCVLKVGKSQFPVHRAVLSARSVVFAAMFNHDTKEKLHGEVDIPDVDPTVLSDVLYYIYSGKIRGLTPDTAVSMYTVADKYALCRLRDVCLDVLLNSLTTENICDAAVLAHMHGETALEKKVIYFIAERVEEFMESDNWRQFAQDRCLLANKLLCSALVTSKKKNIE